VNQWDEEIYAKGLHDNRWPFHQVIATAKRFHKLLNFPVNFAVLELGCGVGNNSIALAHEGFQVTGIDFSSVAIRKAASRSQEQNLDIRFSISSIEDYVIPHGSFDFIFDRGAFVYLSNSQIAKSIGAIYDGLKPGGKFVGFDWYGDKQPDLAWGTISEDGTYSDFTSGRFVNQGSVNFVNLFTIDNFFELFPGKLNVVKNVESDKDENIISETFTVYFQKMK
jgi:SAM-dependent methyltransferase